VSECKHPVDRIVGKPDYVKCLDCGRVKYRHGTASEWKTPVVTVLDVPAVECPGCARLRAEVEKLTTNNRGMSGALARSIAKVADLERRLVVAEEAKQAGEATV